MDKSRKKRSSAKWIGESHDQDLSEIKELKKRHSLVFYKKCALYNMTIQPNDIVCIQNKDISDTECLKSCDIGKVLHLYEDCSNSKPLHRAVVEWCSRPSDLKLCGISESHLKILDEEYEVVQDSRYDGDIDLESIFAVGKMFKTREDCASAVRPKARFFCNYKIQQDDSNKQKCTLIPLREKSRERCDLILKRVQETENCGKHKSPHGKWSVTLNSIENTPRTPKRGSEDDHSTPRKKHSPSTPTSRQPKSKGSALKRTESLLLCENSASTTPTTKGITRRKSILKTPTVGKANTPRRSIQFCSVVEERTFEKKSLLAMDENEEDGTDLASARRRLHVSAVPKSLPCREKEFTEIYSFLEGNLLDQTGGCIYISGVPGTGKTATTTEIIRMLKEEVEKKKLPKFDYVEINGMRITEPRKAYVEIHKQLTGETIGWEQAYNRLDKRFSNPSPRRITTILLVDELDILCNKRQDVVYNLLNWPNLNAARLIVVTIANTMDLPERVFMGKVSSRLGLTRLTFQPYSFKQLQEIVASRLGALDLFNSDAIQLVARKVAALSGDARRALDICRRASEIAESEAQIQNQKPSVSMSHVQQALNEMISCPKVQAIKACSKMEKFFIQAVCVEVERTGIEEVVFRGVYSQFKAISAINGCRVPTIDSALNISNSLNVSRLLISEHSRKDIYQKILLNISPDDFYFATQLRQHD